jgi:hypothetical protein
MLLFCHAMTALIFSHIYLITIQFNTKRKFRQVMVVHPPASDLLPAGLFAHVPKYFLQPVA